MGNLINSKVDASEGHEVVREPQTERSEDAMAGELSQSERWLLEMWRKAEEEHARSAVRLGSLRRSDASDSPDIPRRGLAEELIASGFDVTISYREGEFSIAIGDTLHEPTDPEKMSDGPENFSVMPSQIPESNRHHAPLGPSPFHRDAGLFSYTAGVLGAVAFTALAIGPGWLGFLVAFLPASAFAAWAVAGHG